MSDDHTSNSASPATGIASLTAVTAGRAYDLLQASVHRKPDSRCGGTGIALLMNLEKAARGSTAVLRIKGVF